MIAPSGAIFCAATRVATKNLPEGRLFDRLLTEFGDDEVDNGEGQSTNHKTNDTVKNGVFCFFDLGGVTRRGHVKDTTDYDHDNSDDTEGTNHTVNDVDEYTIGVSWVDSFVADWVNLSG